MFCSSNLAIRLVPRPLMSIASREAKCSMRRCNWAGQEALGQ